jgi:iron complex outermembrane receptor protein
VAGRRVLLQRRDTTDFYQRAWFLQGAARNPNNWVRLRNKNTSWAGFGQLSYAFTDKFTVTAGLRQTKDEKHTRLLKTADTAAGVVTYKGRTDVRMSDTTPSWDLSAMYQITPDVSVYARSRAASAARPSRAVRRCSTPTSPPPIPRPSCPGKLA